MIKTTTMILNEVDGYSCPADKLTRMVQEGEYIPIVRGLYETDKSTPGYLLAGSVYGPSYLSFEFALGYYGLIPEAVYNFTSATIGKKKKKRYETPFGIFTYRDVPDKVYSYGIRIVQEGEYSFAIASAEKAICDQLYKTSPVANYKELEQLLFENLRIDEEDFVALNSDDILFIADKYHSTNVKKLCGLMGRK